MGPRCGGVVRGARARGWGRRRDRERAPGHSRRERRHGLPLHDGSAARGAPAGPQGERQPVSALRPDGEPLSQGAPRRDLRPVVLSQRGHLAVSALAGEGAAVPAHARRAALLHGEPRAGAHVQRPLRVRKARRVDPQDLRHSQAARGFLVGSPQAGRGGCGDERAHRCPTTGTSTSSTRSGPPLSDAWEIGVIAAIGRERTGYPTQKPETLLERIIRSSSNEGDLVLDPFCGCGTAIAVAERLKRRWMGIDVTHLAINIVRERMKARILRRPRRTGRPAGSQAARRGRSVAVPVVDPRAGRCTARGTSRNGGDAGIDGEISFQARPWGPATAASSSP